MGRTDAEEKLSARRKSRAKDEPAGGWGWIVLRAVSLGVILGGAYWGISYGFERMEPYAKAQALSRPLRLEWVALPPWLAAENQRALLAQIEAEAGVLPGDDLFGADLCRRVAHALGGCGWVMEVRSVVKRGDGVIRVDAAFRTPLAWVRVRDQAYLVDEQGVRLPLERVTSDPDLRQWYLIEGGGRKLPPIGHAFDDAGVQAGLRLIQFLHQCGITKEKPLGRALVAVDVANFQRKADELSGRLRLRTVFSERLIDWGEPPYEEFSVEPPAAVKLAMLTSIFERAGDQVYLTQIDLRVGP